MAAGAGGGLLVMQEAQQPVGKVTLVELVAVLMQEEEAGVVLGCQDQ